ncbi:uS17 family ribosomal protein [Acidobacteriota bacterium]
MSNNCVIPIFFPRIPLYVKTIKRSRKFMAHDERNECQVGDKVLIVETRPLSKRKRWKVGKVLDRPA